MHMGRRLVIIGGLFGLLGVGMGAFGSHLLEGILKANDRQSVFDTAVQYQLIHALAILCVSSCIRRWPGGLTRAAGVFFIIGIVLFSGSLYILAIFNIPLAGVVTPIGGVALLLGWLCLILMAWQNNVA
jgi:uncharacterized membrane protein YgdD (TMEM256/DUF423 family)